MIGGIREIPQDLPKVDEAWTVERRLEERTEQVAELFNENRRLRAEIEKHKAMRFVLDLRIRNQRRSNRENWMIVEARGKSLRSSALHVYRRGRALMAEAKSVLENRKPALADAHQSPEAEHGQR